LLTTPQRADRIGADSRGPITRGERGAALVEFVLVLPLLLVLLFGMLDFGKAINYWLDENELANVAARAAAVDRKPDPSSGDSLQEQVLQQADTAELRTGGSGSVPTAANVCISFPNGTSEVGDPVEATVTVDYNWLPVLDIAVTSATLVGSATMRLEAEPSVYSSGCTGS
jgi:Flp pilus assembly protein TadG